MGTSSSDAPPPDPRLVEAQIRSLGVQDDAIGRIIALSEQMAPLQREATQFALDQSRLSATQGQEDRTWMLGRRAELTKLQDKMVQDANTFDARVRGDELAQEAGADAQVAISNARATSGRELARRGIMPGSGRAGDARLVLGEAALMAGAKNTARRAARAEGYALTDRAANPLAGFPAMGMQASGQAAQIAAGGLNVANAGTAGLIAGPSAVTQGAGQMGSNATGMWNAQANYKTQQDKIAADSDPFNTVLGAVAGGVGTAAGLKFFSDRRLKTDIVAVGRDERTGLTLYEFGYIGATDGRRYRGVIADEVERVDPQAVVYDDLGFASVDYARLGLEMVEV